MANINMVLQGKGGVGKSLIASILAQYKVKNGHKPLCINTDQVNPTFEGYKALDVRRVTLIEDNEINPQSFSALIKLIASSQNDVVIDTGTSSFVPLFNYLSNNQVPTLLKSMGHELIMHTIVTGGQALLDTLSDFTRLIDQFQFQKNCLFVVWLNPYFGPIEYKGKRFEQMKTYTDHKDRIAALIKMPTFQSVFYGRDFTEMLKSRLTFDEALAMTSFNILTRQRLKIIQRELFTKLDLAVVL